MKIVYAITIICCTLISNAFGQKEKAPKSFVLSASLFGISPLGPIGEYTFINGKYKAQIVGGISYIPIGQNEQLFIPIGINVFNGVKKSHLQVGLHLSYRKGDRGNAYFPNTWFFSKGIYFIPSVSYRRDKLKKGLIWGIHYTPIILLKDLKNPEKTRERLFKEDKDAPGAISITNRLLPDAKTNWLLPGVSIGYRFGS